MAQRFNKKMLKEEQYIDIDDDDVVEIEEEDGQKRVEIESKEEHAEEVADGKESPKDDLNAKRMNKASASQKINNILKPIQEDLDELRTVFLRFYEGLMSWGERNMTDEQKDSFYGNFVRDLDSIKDLIGSSRAWVYEGYSTAQWYVFDDADKSAKKSLKKTDVNSTMCVNYLGLPVCPECGSPNLIVDNKESNVTNCQCSRCGALCHFDDSFDMTGGDRMRYTRDEYNRLFASTKKSIKSKMKKYESDETFNNVGYTARCLDGSSFKIEYMPDRSEENYRFYYGDNGFFKLNVTIWNKTRYIIYLWGSVPETSHIRDNREYDNLTDSEVERYIETIIAENWGALAYSYYGDDYFMASTKKSIKSKPMSFTDNVNKMRKSNYDKIGKK